VIAGIALGVWLAACGGQKMARSTTSEPPTSPDAMGRSMDADKRAEIERLMAEIDGARPPTMAMPSDAQVAEAMSNAPEISTCDLEPPDTPTCNDSCSISTKICENADAICRIAEELQPDDWSERKCGEAHASCEIAHDTCCACS
jgi:hypothetical protein